MSDAPSPIASSTAGAPLQAHEAVEGHEARRAGQHHAVRRQAQIVNDAGDIVETTDADARVFADTEGSGSQGRELNDQAAGEEGGQAAASPGGITIDADGQFHLDLSA